MVLDILILQLINNVVILNHIFVLMMIFTVMKYIFAGSRYVHNIQKCGEDSNFRFTVLIQCNNACVYDKDIKYRPNIKNMEEYVKQNANEYKQILLDKNDINVENICKLIESNYDDTNTDDILIIVEKNRNKSNHDNIYFTKHAGFACLNKLKTNYLIGMEFYGRNNQMRSYLIYGNENKFRFYPETLISIVSRLFFRANNMKSWEYAFELHQNYYKHGFNLILNDKKFNKMYCQLTGSQHVSNNYNREYLNEISHMKIRKHCNFESESSEKKCEYLEYIAESLTLYS
eukprot:18075_1